MEKTIEWVNVKNREPKLGGYYFCKIDTKQDCIVEGIVEYFKYPNGNMDWDLGDSLTHTNLGENAEVIEWLDEHEFDEKPINDSLNIVLDTKGRTEIIKITEAALEGDKEKAKKFIERYMIKYPESDLIYPFRNLLNSNKNPNGLTK